MIVVLLILVLLIVTRRDRPEREQSEILGLVLEWFAGTGPYWNPHVSQLFLCFLKTLRLHIILKFKLWAFFLYSHNCGEFWRLPFYCSSCFCSINPNRTRNLSLLLLWNAPLHVLANHSKTRPGILSAPSLDCFYKAGATSWSGVLKYIQNKYQ